MTNDEALCLFRETGALLEGHFVLRSGLHSRQFFQCAILLQHTKVAERVCALLAEKLKNIPCDSVISPALGGLIASGHTTHPAFLLLAAIGLCAVLDAVLQARTGIASVTGTPDGPPVRAGVSILDVGAGTWLALAVLAAKEAAERQALTPGPVEPPAKVAAPEPKRPPGCRRVPGGYYCRARRRRRSRAGCRT